MSAGIVTLSVSYGLSFLAGAIMTPIDSSNEETGSACLGEPATTFIPVIGPFLFAANYPSYATVGGGAAGYCPKGAGAAIGVGTALGVAQVVGVGLLTVGAVQLATDEGGGSGSAPTRVALRPTAPSAEQGATLEVAW